LRPDQGWLTPPAGQQAQPEPVPATQVLPAQSPAISDQPPAAPQAEPATPHAESSAPQAEPLAPQAEPFAPQAEPLAPQIEAFAPQVLDSVAASVRRDQTLFARTGAVHAAAAFTRDGEITLVREDVGRHNAVDKVVGRLLLDDALPAHELGLFVSGGRASNWSKRRGRRASPRWSR
jgi:hypothetical protein